MPELKIRYRAKRLKRSWQECLAMEQAIRRATGKPAKGAAAAVLTRSLFNYRRALEARLRGLGIDYHEVLLELPREEPEPFRGPPVQIPRILD
jgi:hypothetical protein